MKLLCLLSYRSIVMIVHNFILAELNMEIEALVDC